MGCHFLLWGIFPTQGLNLCLLHCRLILYHLGSPGWMELALFGGWMDCAQGVAKHGWSLSTHSVISYSGQGVPDLFQWTVVSFHQVSLTPSACRRERAKKEMCKSHHPSTGESWLLWFWASSPSRSQDPCHYHISCMCVRSVTKSCVTLCDSMDCSPPGPSVHGISQARRLEWVAISYSRGSSWPRDWTWVFCISCMARWVLYQPSVGPKGILPFATTAF